MRRYDVPTGRRNAPTWQTQRRFDLGFCPEGPLWPFTGHNSGAGNLEPAPDPRGFIEPFRPKAEPQIPSNNMPYCHGSGTSGLPCTPLFGKGAGCVLIVGHPSEELPVPGSSAEVTHVTGIPAKPGSQRSFHLGFWPSRPERPVWPAKPAKQRVPGPSGQNGPVCACCPKHQRGTAALRPFYPWSGLLSTFTREAPSGADRMAARGPSRGPVLQGLGSLRLAAFGGQTARFWPKGPERPDVCLLSQTPDRSGPYGPVPPSATGSRVVVRP